MDKLGLLTHLLSWDNAVFERLRAPGLTRPEDGEAAAGTSARRRGGVPSN